MMKKQTFVQGMVIFFVLFGIAITQGLEQPPTLVVKGTPGDYTIVVDSAKQPILDEGAGTLEAKYTGDSAIKFSYSNASLPAVGHITLASGGYIQDYGRFMGLTGVYVDFTGEGSLKLSYGVSTRTANTTVLTDDTWVTSLVANHFKLFAEDGPVTINSVTFAYTCFETGTPVTEVTISGDNYAVIDETITLTVLVAPENATDKHVTWSSNNVDVATVNSAGVVTGVAAGTVTITATADGTSSQHLVNVMEMPVDGDLTDEQYTTPLTQSNTTYANDMEVTIKTYFGASGFFASFEVTDSEVGSASHLEVPFMLDSAPAVGRAWQLRLYPSTNTMKKYNYRTPGGDGFSWNEITTFESLFDIEITAKGYNAEVYIPYSTLGLVAAPSNIKILTAVFFYMDSTRTSTFGSASGIKVTNVLMWSPEFYHTFTNTGYFDDYDMLNPDVKITMNGSIENTGSNETVVASAKKLNTSPNATSFIAATPIFVADRFGTPESALKSNSQTGAYAVVEGFGLSTSSWTMSSWMYFEGLSTGNGSPLFANRKMDGSDQGIRITLRKESGGSFKIGTAATNLEGQNSAPLSGFATGSWQHIVITRSADNLYIYVNGVMVFSRQVTVTSNLGSTPISFGGYIGETWNYSNTHIYFDDIMLFSKGISGHHVKQIYDATKPVS